MVLLTWVGPVLEAGILLGLVVRHRLREAICLPVLLVALIVSATTVGVCPTCNTWDFWVAKELVHAGLLLALGLELAHRAFTAPAPRRAARRWTLFVLVGMIVLLATAEHRLLVVEVLPRLTASIAWLYTGLSIIMLRHNRRIEGLHDTILTAFAAYLMAYAAVWSQFGRDTRVVAFVNPPVQIAVLAALLYAAWAPPRATGAPARGLHSPSRDTKRPPDTSRRCAVHVAALVEVAP